MRIKTDIRELESRLSGQPVENIELPKMNLWQKLVKPINPKIADELKTRKLTKEENRLMNYYTIIGLLFLIVALVTISFMVFGIGKVVLYIYDILKPIILNFYEKYF